MNIDNIITELGKRQLIGSMPENHLVRKREDESDINSNTIDIKTETLQDNQFRKNANITNIGELIWIPDGDLEDFPDISNLDERISEGDGMDALAWYRSFHWYDPHNWGIYITDRGLYYLAKKIFFNLNQVNDLGKPYNMLDLLQQAFNLLYLHEYFHFITDISATVLELGSRSSYPFYINYSKSVYTKYKSSPNEPLEEALANAFAYSKFPYRCYPKSDIRKSIRSSMDKQPNGYKGYGSFLGKNFIEGKRKLGTIISQTDHNPKPLDGLEILFDHNRSNIRDVDVPVYIVNQIQDSRYNIGFVDKILKSSIDHSRKFKKDLKKMPQKIVEKLKWTLDMIENNLMSHGLNFEKLKSCNTVFSIRLDIKYRFTLKPISNDIWQLLRIGKHDDIYRHPI